MHVAFKCAELVRLLLWYSAAAKIVHEAFVLLKGVNFFSGEDSPNDGLLFHYSRNGSMAYSILSLDHFACRFLKAKLFSFHPPQELDKVKFNLPSGRAA